MTDSQSSLQAKNISILVTSLESCLTYGALIFESSGGYSLLIGLISEKAGLHQGFLGPALIKLKSKP